MIETEATVDYTPLKFEGDICFRSLLPAFRSLASETTGIDLRNPDNISDESRRALRTIVDDVAFWMAYDHTRILPLLRLRGMAPLLFNHHGVLKRFMMSMGDERDVVEELVAAGITSMDVAAVSEAMLGVATDVEYLVQKNQRSINYCRTLFETHEELQRLVSLSIQLVARETVRQGPVKTLPLQKEFAERIRARIRPPQDKSSDGGRRIWAVRKRLDRFIWGFPDKKAVTYDDHWLNGTHFRAAMAGIFF